MVSATALWDLGLPSASPTCSILCYTAQQSSSPSTSGLHAQPGAATPRLQCQRDSDSGMVLLPQGGQEAVLELPEAFERLLAYGLAQYHGLQSRARTDDDGHSRTRFAVVRASPPCMHLHMHTPGRRLPAPGPALSGIGMWDLRLTSPTGRQSRRNCSLTSVIEALESTQVVDFSDRGCNLV